LSLDAEDSLAFEGPLPRPDSPAPTVLDVAAIRWPHVSNATDLDPISIEPGIGVRWVTHAAALGTPDLIVLPGTKSTVADLRWLQATGLADAVCSSTASLLGICGGYQMLGRGICDPAGIEAPAGSSVAGLGLLDVETKFEEHKVVRRRSGTGLGATVTGYEIHHGRTTTGHDTTGHDTAWLYLDGQHEGATSADGRIRGTNLHGLFDSDEFRHAFLSHLAAARGKPWTRSEVDFGAAREAQVERLADLVDAHLDIGAVDRLIEAAR
jgi:adenosylcobyric acid synthase